MKWYYGQIIAKYYEEGCCIPIPKLLTCLETRLYSKKDIKHFEKVLNMLKCFNFEEWIGTAMIKTDKQIPIEIIRTKLKVNKINDKIIGSNLVSSFWYPKLVKKYNK